VAALCTFNVNASGFDGMIATGGMASVFDIVFCGAGIMTVLLARDYFERVGGLFDEFYTLLMMSISSMMLISHSSNFMPLFVGIEVMSICFYVMSGLLRGRLSSNEAALKYFLLGAFASGFLLYGMALIYGATGTMNYTGVLGFATSAHAAGSTAPLSHGISTSPVIFWIGVGLLIVGLAFKVAAFPFHQWAPDVYQGAPTVVTGFMSTAGKAAAFSGFVGFLMPVFASGADGLAQAQQILALLAVGSMLIGNITAISQTNIKRMLAYSSIAHAGYAMIGLAAGNMTGWVGIVYYLSAYLFMQLGAFAVVGILERDNGENLTVEDYRGLGRRRPGLAIVMSLFMFSLTGIPPFAGFFGKYYLFAAAIEAHLTWLTIVGVISSVISAWFYLGLVVNMFFREADRSEAGAATPAIGTKLALALTIAGTLVVGFIPELILRVAAVR
jgi:NADH-quinone oxidoreductase subunit N